jgi:hypothetical protein
MYGVGRLPPGRQPTAKANSMGWTWHMPFPARLAGEWICGICQTLGEAPLDHPAI